MKYSNGRGSRLVRRLFCSMCPPPFQQIKGVGVGEMVGEGVIVTDGGGVGVGDSVMGDIGEGDGVTDEGLVVDVTRVVVRSMSGEAPKTSARSGLSAHAPNPRMSIIPRAGIQLRFNRSPFLGALWSRSVSKVTEEWLGV